MADGLELGVDRELEGAVPGYLPWIFAVADPRESDLGQSDRGGSWWERAGGNPKRMGEWSQAAFLVRAQSFGIWVGGALGRQREVRLYCMGSAGRAVAAGAG